MKLNYDIFVALILLAALSMFLFNDFKLITLLAYVKH